MKFITYILSILLIAHTVKADTEDAILTPNPEPETPVEPAKPKKTEPKKVTHKKVVKKYALTVKTKPAGATVRITDIKPKYHAGIRLAPRTYTIKVTKAGYYPVKQSLTIRNKDVTKTIVLTKIPVKKSESKKEKTISPPVVKSTPTPKLKRNDKRIGQYIDHGDGTVTDTKTGLMWKKCSEGQYGNNCQGKPEIYTWNDAMQKFKRISFAGYNNWRMPTIEELRILVYCSNGKPQQQASNEYGCSLDDSEKDYIKPTINQRAFPNVYRDSTVWSSTRVASNAHYTWIVNFHSGYDHWSGKSGNWHVRLVRSRQ